MKWTKIIYWVTTILSMLLGPAFAVMYFSNPKFIEAFEHLGFPDYFRIELGVLKIAGLLVILIPAFPAKLKEWDYVGFGIVFLSAIIAHFSVDGIQPAKAPAVGFVLLTVSYMYFHKLKSETQILK